MKSKQVILGVLGLICISILGIISYQNSGYRNGTYQSVFHIPRETKPRIMLLPSWGESYDSGDGSFDKMTEESDLIALITVDGIERTYGAEGIPFTEFNVSVDTPIYQVEKGDKFIIVMTGQETETDITEIPSDPLMIKGEKALVFCKKMQMALTVF